MSTNGIVMTLIDKFERQVQDNSKLELSPTDDFPANSPARPAMQSFMDAFGLHNTFTLESTQDLSRQDNQLQVKGQLQIFAEQYEAHFLLKQIEEEILFEINVPQFELHIEQLLTDNLLPQKRTSYLLEIFKDTKIEKCQLDFRSQTLNGSLLSIFCANTGLQWQTLNGKLALQEIGFDIVRGFHPNSIGTRLFTMLELGGENGLLLELAIDIPADNSLPWSLGLTEAVLVGDIVKTLDSFIELAEAKHLLPSSSSFADVLPPNFAEQLNVLEISNFDLHFTPTSKITFANIRFQSHRSWYICPGLTIANAGLTVTAQLGDIKQIDVTIFGSIRVNSLRVHKENALSFSAALKVPVDTKRPCVLRMESSFAFGKQHQIDINDFPMWPKDQDAKFLQPGDLPDSFIKLESIQLRDFTIIFNPWAKQDVLQEISVDVIVSGEVNFDNFLTFAKPQFQLTLQYPFDKKKRSVRGGGYASIYIGESWRFLVEASYNSSPNDQAKSGSDTSWKFEGKTAPGTQIQIGKLIEDIGQEFGGIDLPETISGFTIDSIDVSYQSSTEDNASSNHFNLSCESQFPIDDQQVKIILNIDIQNLGQGKFEKKLTGSIIFGNVSFILELDSTESKNSFAAILNGDEYINIKELIATVSPSLSESLPEIEINLKDALFIYSKTKDEPKAKYLFGLDIGAHFNLSQLPLVGEKLSLEPEQTIGVDDLQLIISNKSFTQKEVVTLNTLIPVDVTKLPDSSKDTDTSQPSGTSPETDTQKTALNKGLNVTAQLKFGLETRALTLPASSQPLPGDSQASTDATTKSTPQTAVTSDNAKWFKLQKNFGPVHFERVGVQYQDATLWFLLDAALSASGLTLSLDGLAVGSPLSQFEPKFQLKGIGIDYQSGSALEIGGAFLRKQITKDGKTVDEYDGAAVIKSETFTLSAIGSYSEDAQGDPSLFIYAVLDKPLGGPSFFFVTGLAAGFGYNRALKIPTIDQVVTFPLVEEAINSKNSSSDTQDGATQLTQELNKLQEYIPPETGQTFLAVGVKFTSFKIIDSFALLTVAFGNRFEVNLLGLSTLVAPPEVDKTPVAEVQLALKATFLPEEGFLGVRGQLTPKSYILSKKCHLTGGFAFYSWFSPSEHDGDFVFTLGGYHPQFNVPAHYPKVPRLAFNWQVNSQLNIKADGYFALTAAALMAGGHLQATWHSGHLKAWFKAGADFLIAWKPYHYDASIYVDMGVSYTYHFFGTHHITVDVGADLHIWGPEFTGKAHIHLWIVSFTVSFGASASQTPQPIDWTTFKSSFLPADSDICSVAVKDGLVRKINQDDKSDLGVINPKHLCLVTNSVIPATQVKIAEGNTTDIRTIYYENEKYTQIKPFTKIDNQFQQETSAYSREISAPGIGSMEVRSADLTSTYSITIKKQKPEGNFENVEKECAYIPILKKAPTGLWGESLTPDLNGEQFIENTLFGFEIKPKKQHEPGKSHAIDRQNLQFTTESVNDAYKWETIKVFNEQGGKNIRDTITESSVKTTRDNLLKAINLDISTIDLSANIADHLLLSPKIGAL